MICTSLQNKSFEQILEILEDPAVEMAEIRLDRCPLTDEQIEELFSESDTPLIATCRIAESASEEEAERRLRLAVEAGARFADLEIEAPAPVSIRFQHLCRKQGTEIIRSFLDFEVGEAGARLDGQAQAPFCLLLRPAFGEAAGGDEGRVGLAEEFFDLFVAEGTAVQADFRHIDRGIREDFQDLGAGLILQAGANHPDL